MWRPVFEADLISRLSLDEIDAFRQQDGGDGDVIARAIAGEVAYVRGIIRSAPSGIRLSSDESMLPESLISPAMDHLRFNVLTRLNYAVNDSRTKAYEQANVLFDQVRKGDFIPEPSAENADTSGNVAGSPVSATAKPKRLLD